MFNTYHTHTSPRSIHVSQRTEVTEKRAPTDESVRLLKEMEAEARKKVLNSIPLSNTNLDIQLLVEENMMAMEATFHLLMRVNGERHKCKLSMPDNFTRLDKQGKIEAIQSAAANALAAIFLQELPPASKQAIMQLLR